MVQPGAKDKDYTQAIKESYDPALNRLRTESLISDGVDALVINPDGSINVDADMQVNDADVAIDNPVPITTGYEKIIQAVLASKWMELAVYDEVVTTVSPDRQTITMDFKEDTFLIGTGFINFSSDLSWTFVLERYLLDDDGSMLLDDDDTPLFLE